MSVFVRLRVVTDVWYLGKHSVDGLRVASYFDPHGRSVVSVLGERGVSVVQAWKKLALSESQVGKLDLQQLHLIASSHGARIELHSTMPTREQVERIERPRQQSAWIRSALAKVERDLEREKDAYAKWRGVRDLDEAHGNLRDRHEEIFDLNQKLVANARSPSFVQLPHRYQVSAWQHTDRTRFNELRYQSRQRATAVKQRIDFTRKNTIKELEQKLRDVKAQLAEEEKKEAKQRERIQALLDGSVSLGVVLTVQSRPLLVKGRKGAAVSNANDEVQQKASALQQQLQERLGLRFQSLPGERLLASVFTPDLGALAASKDSDARGLVSRVRSLGAICPSAELEKRLQATLLDLLGSGIDQAGVPDLSRFPTADAKDRTRLAYLGLALRDDLSMSPVPVFYDLDEQGPRHTAVVGGSGSGKSVAASLIVEGAAMHGVPVLVFDSTRSWTGFALPCTQQALLSRYDGFHLKEEYVTGFPVKILDPDADSGLGVRSILHSRDIHVLASTKLTDDQEAEAVKRLLEDVYEEIKTWKESKHLRALLVLEEAHRYLSDPRLKPVLELFARTSRAKGVGLLIVSQVAVDLPPAIRNNMATKVQLQTNYAQDLKRSAQVYGTENARQVPRLKQGQGVLHFPEYGAAFIAFRPPLHSPLGIPEDVARFYMATEELGHEVARVMRHVATNDAATCRKEETPHDGPNGPLSDESPANVTEGTTIWRDVATRYLTQSETKPTARQVHEAIQSAGVEAPSLRTVQRLLSSQL